MCEYYFIIGEQTKLLYKVQWLCKIGRQVRLLVLGKDT